MSRETPWEFPKPLLEPHEDHIHVWRSRLIVSRADRVMLRSFLSDDERARASRFRFQQDRHRFIVARGMLRKILARYLPKTPAELAFRHEQYGKPALRMDTHSRPLSFNVSYAKDVALYAVGLHRDIGVDVEDATRTVNGLEIAQRYFSPSEALSLLSLPPALQAGGFFDCWTRKEAYLKARGEGLRVPLDSFEVTLAPGKPGRFLRGVGRNWQLVTFCAQPGFPAALVYSGVPCALRFLSWD